MLNPISNLHDRPLRMVSSVFNDAVYTIFQFLLLTIVLLGIGGLAFNVFGSDGWLLSSLLNAWQRDPAYLLLMGGAIVVGSGWIKPKIEQRLAELKHIGDILIYGWVVLGVYFLARLIMTGAL